jgi:hypothetical protein
MILLLLNLRMHYKYAVERSIYFALLALEAFASRRYMIILNR